MATLIRIIRAPRGAELTCSDWPQEAALRMLMNNLDPDVAERPEDLVVYGGFPGFVPEYIRPLSCEGKGPFRWVALSGDPVGSPTRLRSRYSAVSATRSTPEWSSSLTAEADQKLDRVLTCDPGLGVLGHADAVYRDAIATAERQGLRIPMREEREC